MQIDTGNPELLDTVADLAQRCKALARAISRCKQLAYRHQTPNSKIFQGGNLPDECFRSMGRDAKLALFIGRVYLNKNVQLSPQRVEPLVELLSEMEAIH